MAREVTSCLLKCSKDECTEQTVDIIWKILQRLDFLKAWNKKEELFPNWHEIRSNEFRQVLLDSL